MKDNIFRIRHLGFVSITCFAIASCGDLTTQYDDQYEMLEAAGASDLEKCKLAQEASDSAFENSERAAFLKWSEIKKATCVVSEGGGLSFDEAMGRTGVVEGEYSYPSDYIPEDIEACVSNVETQEMICGPKRQGNKFSFDLPPGKYRIWAETADNPGYRAYYTEAVRCGLSHNCTDHTAITISLEAGQKLDGVNPHDWYAGN